MGEPQTYGWWDQVPDHLKTKTQLNELGLKPGPAPAAFIHYGRGRRERHYSLFDVNTATPKRVATAAQLAALEKAQQALRTCPQCTQDKGSRAALSEFGICYDCLYDAEIAERARDRDAMIVWARDLLAQPFVVLDTETVDMGGAICEISVIGSDGTVLLDTLVNPEQPNRASHIHGITDEMCADKPTFAQIEPELRRILHGAIVAVYNVDYDYGVLIGELNRLSMTVEQSNAWLRAATWIDVMEPFSQYAGEWSEYHGNYRWQRLEGGHRALGDCQACLSLIRMMAAAKLSTDS